MSTNQEQSWVMNNINPQKKPNRFIIERELDTRFWSLLPEINWNIHFCEIELRWLCFGIMFRDDKRFHEKSTKTWLSGK